MGSRWDNCFFLCVLLFSLRWSNGCLGSYAAVIFRIVCAWALEVPAADAEADAAAISGEAAEAVAAATILRVPGPIM